MVGRKFDATDYVFQSERAGRMSRSAFWRIVAQAGERAGLPVKAYAHLLRHSCGYFLANKGCDLRLIPPRRIGGPLRGRNGKRCFCQHAKSDRIRQRLYF
jgi:integrase